MLMVGNKLFYTFIGLRLGEILERKTLFSVVLAMA